MPSTPQAPALDFTFFQASSSVLSDQTLPAFDCKAVRPAVSLRSAVDQAEQQPVSPFLTRAVRGNGCRSCARLRHSLEGSPLLETESDSLSFGTAGPPRAALHPVSRRRSCLRLLSRCSSRDDSDFHWLISCMCARTRDGSPSGPTIPSSGRSKQVRRGSYKKPFSA